VLQQSSSLFWDSTNNRLGIGTNTPTSAMQILGSTNVEGLLNITNNTTLNFANAVNILFPNTVNGNQVAGFYIGKALSSKNGWGVSYTHSSDGSNSNRGSIDFFGVNSILNWFASGNVAINTTTDAGFRLDVNGTARVSGSTFLCAQNTSGGNGVNIGTFSLGTIDINQRILQVDAGLYPTIIVNANNVVKGAVSANGFSSALSMFVGTITNHPLSFGTNDIARMRIFNNGNVGINTTTDAGFKLDVNGTARTGAATIQTLTVGLGAGSQSNNTVLGLSALSSNTSGNFNVAIGPSSLFSNTTGTGNIGIGHFSAVQISNGTNNIAIGREALSNGNSSGNVVVGMQACNVATGSNNVVLGLQAQAGNFSGSVVLGRAATADGNNQFVVGSTTYNAGIIDTATVTPDKRWIVKINGVNYYIALQTV
jgi:hypothetical protein